MPLVAVAVAQAPPVGLVTAMVMFAGAGEVGCRPVPLKVMGDCPAATTTLLEPSSPDLVWMMRGATVSEAAVLQAPVGSSRLMTQLVPVVLTAHEADIASVSWKRTRVLRLTASARAI